MLSSALDKLNAEDQTGKPHIPRVPVLHNCRGHCSENDIVEYNLELPVLSPAFFLPLSFPPTQVQPTIPICSLQMVI